MAPKKLKKISVKKVCVFKIANRRGYGAICMKNLTEGRHPEEALHRMAKALKRRGYLLVR